MRNLYHSLIRASAFLGKEIAEVIRQPRLIFEPRPGTVFDLAPVRDRL